MNSNHLDPASANLVGLRDRRPAGDGTPTDRVFFGGRDASESVERQLDLLTNGT